MQDNAADGGTAKGRGSGVGAVAAARNRELQASERTTNAMAVAAGFLRCERVGVWIHWCRTQRMGFLH